MKEVVSQKRKRDEEATIAAPSTEASSQGRSERIRKAPKYLEVFLLLLD